jgi:anti-anti-sigma factor
MLSVRVEYSEGTVILHCHGRIVRGDETAILCAATQQNRRNVVLDLQEVEALDAAGIGAFLALQAAGIYLQLRNPHGQVREALRVTRLESVFDISESPSSTQIEEPRVAVA